MADTRRTAHRYTVLLTELYRLESKRATLETQNAPEQLETNEHYHRVQSCANELHKRAEEILHTFDDMTDAYRSIDCATPA